MTPDPLTNQCPCVNCHSARLVALEWELRRLRRLRRKRKRVRNGDRSRG